MNDIFSVLYNTAFCRDKFNNIVLYWSCSESCLELKGFSVHFLDGAQSLLKSWPHCNLIFSQLQWRYSTAMYCTKVAFVSKYMSLAFEGEGNRPWKDGPTRHKGSFVCRFFSSLLSQVWVFLPLLSSKIQSSSKTYGKMKCYWPGNLFWQGLSGKKF